MEETVPFGADHALGIRLLGELAVVRAGTAVPLPASKRTRALLGYLVATGAPVSRQTLCDLLWDGPDDPRAALRWSLTKLRPVVDDVDAARLVADRDRVAFAAGDALVDLNVVARLLAAGADAATVPMLEQAAMLLHGEFLDGLDLPACYRFHNWCMAERERYGVIRRAVLTELIVRFARQPGAALPHARALVAAEPLDETAHATLVRLLGGAGRYPDAEQHYEYARALLRREISARPGGPLDEAIHAVRRSVRAAVDGPQATSVKSESRESRDSTSSDVGPSESNAGAGREGADAELAATAFVDVHACAAGPLVGRFVERSAIQAALASGAHDHRTLLLFVGEPGIGKTSLLDYLADTARAAGYRVLRGRCFEAETVRPYGLWLDALQPLKASLFPPPDSVRKADGAPLADRLFGADEDLLARGREQLFGVVAQTLREVAAEQPLVLVLDDLQWLDEGSAALLHFLCRSLGADTPVIFSGAARSGQIDDNHWARRMIQSLSRAGHLQTHVLAPFEEAEVAELLAHSAASIEPQHALRESGGNPLFIVELARAGDRSLARRGQSLDGLIDARLAELGDDARELLSWAAAIGHELQLELLAEAMSITIPELFRRLDRVHRWGLLRATGDGHFDFSHDLVRAAVYRALTQPRRRAIHRQFARVLLAACENAPGLHGELVHHASLADDPLMTAQACVAAGEHCLRVFANAEAAAVAKRGLAHVVRVPQRAEQIRLTISLFTLQAVSLGNSGVRRLPELAGQLECAIEAADALSLHAEAAQGLHIVSWLRQQANDTERVRTATLDAERMTRKADVITRCRQLANTARCLLEVEADLPQARSLLEQADSLASSLELRVIELLWGRGLLARAEGDLDTASTDIARAVALARLHEDHWREYECVVWLAILAFERERFDDVIAHATDAVEIAQRMGDERAPFAETLRALARLHLNDTLAEADVSAGLDGLREMDDMAHLSYALNEAAALALRGGCIETAQRYALEALQAATTVRRPTEAIVAASYLVEATAGQAQLKSQRLDELRRLSGDVLPGRRAAAALERAERGCGSIPTLVSTRGH